jgi:hypothetical protein
MQEDRDYGGTGGLGGGTGAGGAAGAAGTTRGTAGAGNRTGGMEELGRRADEAMDEAAETLAGAAERIDRLSDRIPRRGVGNRAGEMGHSAADALESVARFLRDNDVEGLQRDLGRLVSGRPLSMLLLAVAAGFVAGKVLR